MAGVLLCAEILEGRGRGGAGRRRRIVRQGRGGGSPAPRLAAVRGLRRCCRAGPSPSWSSPPAVMRSARPAAP
ncbi:hypothetical protein EJB05_16068 [Eragrostis curvula]|uniref:Uncharacterized protein n=1 Tax=Eragrostis curvula TaxID=38414 RepID=A0A5J9VFM2_9POAL|nr:hypothetical protein EJB05_16068 [Eragrostis curvula]